MADEKDRKKEDAKEIRPNPATKVEHSNPDTETHWGGKTFNENADNDASNKAEKDSKGAQDKEPFEGHGPDPSRLGPDGKPDPAKNRGGLQPFSGPAGSNLGGESFAYENQKWTADKEEIEKAAQTVAPVEGQLPHRIGNEYTMSEISKQSLNLVTFIPRLQGFFDSLKLKDDKKKEADELIKTLKG